MIELHIKSTPEQRENQEEFSNKLHKALRGWESYINSDVLLNVDDEDETIFLIGPDNGKNVAFEIDLENIKEKELASCENCEHWYICNYEQKRQYTKEKRVCSQFKEMN